jgi:hypothetical protein
MAKTSKTDGVRKHALDKALRGMFGKLQARPVPERLASVVDQLEAADKTPVEKAG